MSDIMTFSPGRFAGKRAVITGGGSGIGRACAVRMAAEGASLMILDIRDNLCEETVRLIRKAGGKAVWAHCDVSSEDEVGAAFEKTRVEYGGVDVLVANAGIATRGLLHELSLHDWEMVLRVNLTGVFLCARAAIRAMLQAGGGAIVTVGSVSSMVIGAGGSAASYKAAKGGVLQLTRAIAVEYASDGIRANCVCPGLVRTNLPAHNRELAKKTTTQPTRPPTPMNITPPMARAAEPEEVASVVAFLASDEASFVTGAAVMVDGGYTAI